MKKPNHYSQIAAIAIAALALSHATSFADNEQVEAYQMTVVAKNGAKQSVVLVKPDVVTGPKYYTKSKEFSINGKLYAISDIQSFRIEKTMVSAITDINADQAKPQNNNVYSINGQIVKHNSSSLSDLPKGIYIVNGKKHIVK